MVKHSRGWQGDIEVADNGIAKLNGSERVQARLAPTPP